MNRKIMLSTNVNIYKKHKNDKINNIVKKFPLIKKILERLPQKFVDYIFVDDYYVTERIFEKCFVFMNIAEIPQGSRLLDVGCEWREFSLELSCLGYNVLGNRYQ